MNVVERIAQYSALEGKTFTHETRSPGPHILAYVRVSTKYQVKEGHSIEAQRQIISNYISMNKLQGTLKFYEDHAISGKDMKNRPNFQSMINFMRKGDTIISYSLSRLGRNTQEILNFADKLEKSKINLIVIDTKIDTSNAAGRLFFTMMAAMGQFEREQVSERTKAVMNHRKDEGYLVTRPPFGYAADPKTKKLVPVEEEQKVITLIIGMIYENSDIKDSEITKLLQNKLESGEITMRKSKRVYQSAVRNIITRHNIRNLVEQYRASNQYSHTIPSQPTSTTHVEPTTIEQPVNYSSTQNITQTTTNDSRLYQSPYPQYPYYPYPYPYQQSNSHDNTSYDNHSAELNPVYNYYNYPYQQNYSIPPYNYPYSVPQPQPSSMQ